MKLVVRSNDATIAEVPCQGEPVYLGSAEDSAVRLDDAAIQPRQLRFAPTADGWTVEPLSAEPPTFVNGDVVASATPVHHGDLIRVGPFEVISLLGDAEAPEAAGAADAPEAPSAPRRTSVENLTRFVQFQLPPGSLVRRPEEGVTLAAPQLGRLSSGTLLLGQCETIERVMEVLVELVHRHLGAFRVWVGIRRVNYGAMEYVEGRLATGTSAELTAVGESLKPRVLDRGQYVLLPHASAAEPFSVLVGPLSGPDGTLGMLYADSQDSERRFESRDLDFFQALSQLAAYQLDAIFKFGARQRAETVAGEVSVVHAIQQRLTPRKLPQWEQLQWGAFREPGREHSGDIYDIVKLSNQTAAFMLAHTQATGPRPSQLIAQVQATFRASSMHLDPPHVFMRMMNHLLYDSSGDLAQACLAGALDPASGELKLAMAGVVGAYIISARGEERKVQPAAPTPMLGVERNYAYPLFTEQLRPGETLVLFTPGVTTAHNRNEEVFGEDRFINILCDGFGQLASAMLKDMLSDLQQFTQGGKQPNDITVILAHRVA